MTLEETKRIHASRVGLFLSKVTERALSGALLVGDDAVENGLRTSSYHFVMHIRTEMAATGEFHKMYDRNLEHWAQSFTFMNAFVRLALTFSQFVYTVAKSIKRNIKEHKNATESDTQLINLPFLLPKSSS